MYATKELIGQELRITVRLSSFQSNVRGLSHDDVNMLVFVAIAAPAFLWRGSTTQYWTTR